MTWVLGLTGGIGSGKSAAADHFARLGVTVVDADAIAHQLTGPGGQAIGSLRAEFGDPCLASDGALDRKYMRELAFTDAGARRRLEAILHPMIREESSRQLAASTSPYAVSVVPLLIESPGYKGRVHRVAVVDCPEELQLARVMTRSGLSADEVRRILDAQTSRSRRLEAADDVIDNSGTLEDLRGQIEALHGRYLGFAQAHQSPNLAERGESTAVAAPAQMLQTPASPRSRRHPS